VRAFLRVQGVYKALTLVVVPPGRSRWDEQVGFLGGDAVPNRIMFHQFEPHLVSSDDKGNITVYDGEKNMRLNRFANGSPVNVPISTLRFVNEDDVALLMTASGAESSSPKVEIALSSSPLTRWARSRRRREAVPGLRVAGRCETRLVFPRHL
jgi:hypothetical protein